MAPVRRLQALATQLGARSVAVSSPASATVPEVEIFVNLSSVESYVSLDTIIQVLGGHRLRWRSAGTKARMSVAVGMMREQTKDPVRQSYQLRVLQTYAALRGLPLDVPREPVDTAAAEAALAFASQQPSAPTVVPDLLRRCFAALFDPARRGTPVERLLEEAGGDVNGFAAWPAHARDAAVAEDRQASEAAGVWTTPWLVDTRTGDAFVGEESLELLVSHLRGPSKVPVLPPPIPATGSRSAAKLEVYVDLKSPYAFLAIEPTYALEEDFNVELEWRPLFLDIKGFLGSAEVGAKDNKVKEGTDKRTPAQWRAVKYAYMNVRRYAAERKPPLTIYGTRKIWNTTLAGVAMLFAADAGALRELQQHFWPPFWRRELDAEDLESVMAILRKAGIDTTAFPEFAKNEGLRRFEEIQQEARRLGIFGVPTYVLDGEVLFGREHLPLLRHRLYAAGLAKRQAQEVLASPYLWTRNELFAGF